MQANFSVNKPSQELWANRSLRLDDQSDTSLGKKNNKMRKCVMMRLWTRRPTRPLPSCPTYSPPFSYHAKNLWPNCLLKSKIFTASAERFSSLRPWVRRRWGYTTTWLTLRSVASARPGPVFSAGAAKQTAWCSVSTLSEVFSDRTMTLTHFLS